MDCLNSRQQSRNRYTKSLSLFDRCPKDNLLSARTSDMRKRNPTSTSIGLPARLSAIIELGNPNPPTSVHCFNNLSTVPGGIVNPLAFATDSTSSMMVRQSGSANGEDSKNGLVRSLTTEVREFQQQFLRSAVMSCLLERRSKMNVQLSSPLRHRS